MKKLISALLICISLSACFTNIAYAKDEKASYEGSTNIDLQQGDASAEATIADDISKSCIYQKNGGDIKMTSLQNGSLDDLVTFDSGSTLSIKSEGKIGSIYVQFYNIPNEWELSSQNGSIKCGTNGFLHEFIDTSDLDTNDITLNFKTSTSIAELYVFSNGTVPDFVQIWETPCEKADLLLLVSHSDDEHLFFGGVLPYYSALGYNVQVAYLTNHNNYKIRTHEQLNSLWTAGVKNYPVIGEFPDLYSKELDLAYSLYREKGYSESDFIEFEVYLLRRFKPLVVMTHDFNGEYGHGTHKICANAMSKAVFDAADSLKYIDSAEKYGTWSTPKLYFHLYSENNITLSFADTPMEQLGGKTPFYYSQQAYLCNTSQLPEPSLTKWMCGTESNPVTLASSIGKYSPLSFGLYTSTVGNDTEGKGDPFENIITYNKQAELLEDEREKNEKLLNDLKAENDRREQQLKELEQIEQSKKELETLKAEYALLVSENDTKILNIKKITLALYIASATFAVVFIFTLLSLIVSLKMQKKKRKIRRKNDNIQK